MTEPKGTEPPAFSLELRIGIPSGCFLRVLSLGFLEITVTGAARQQESLKQILRLV